MATQELLTPAEAAVVADVTVRDVNRVFDERILPDTFLEAGDRRRVRSEACAFVRFYFHAAERLTAGERVHVIHRLIAAPRHGGRRSRVVEHDFLSVNFEPFEAETLARHEALDRAREMVVEDPNILGGAPVVRGTRIPVHDVAAALNAGRSTQEIQAAYSTLNAEQIELARLYASANPQRGRPSTSQRKGMELVSEKRVARRRRT